MGTGSGPDRGGKRQGPNLGPIAVFPTHSEVWYTKHLDSGFYIIRSEAMKGCSMNMRRALFITALLVPSVVAGPAVAQFPPQQQEPPCFKAFSKLRDDTQQKGLAIQKASKAKVGPQVACRLFTALTTAEAKMVKYAVENATWCGIPAQALEQMKQGHAKANQIRAKICRVAAAPPPPSGPTLSDALGGGIPNANNIKTGRGTYDTLTGSALGDR
jgi:hypothetical protein